MISRTEDMLDALTAEEARSDSHAAQEWEAMKIAVQLLKARKAKGLSQADVARRMGLPQQRVADIERRPWVTGFGRILAYARAIGSEVGVVGEPVVSRPNEASR